MSPALRAEREKNRKIESTRLPHVKVRGQEDPSVWFGLDDGGHRTARNIRDLARAVRRKDFAEAEMCLDMIGRDDSNAREEIAMGRQSA